MIPCSSTIMLGELKEIQFNEGVAKIIFDAMSASEMPVFRLQWSECNNNNKNIGLPSWPSPQFLNNSIMLTLY